jgi:hypothetical protein
VPAALSRSPAPVVEGSAGGVSGPRAHRPPELRVEPEGEGIWRASA